MSLPLITSSKPLLPLLLTECLCPPKILVKILPSNVMVLRDGAFGRQLGHEVGVPKNEISVPIIRDMRDRAFSLSAM